MKKRLLSLCLSCFLLVSTLFSPLSLSAEEIEGVAYPLSVSATSAVLMEAETGEILFAQNENEALPPASVTKVMTLLLIMEAIEGGKIAWDSVVSVSERAASMGGSQVFLDAGEQMTVEDLVKSVVIASANDAALALAEFVAGSEEAFVAAMNKRAAELGMTSAHFENTNGLDDTTENHLLSALDIAKMSRALIAYPEILAFSSTWMDTIRGGEFTLTNTNRLVRFYPGATGLKTGSTAKAKFCISATAERDGVSLIAVIMGAESRDVRNEEAKKLLDYGFANYGLYKQEGGAIAPIAVTGGKKNSLALSHGGFAAALPKEKLSSVRYEVILPESVAAPVKKGDAVGKISYYIDGEIIGECDILAEEAVERISFLHLLLCLLSPFLGPV
ncbi:MAG: D-alanyl-D-alanine carboxypeptidase [Clostridia bacterium]|nr:D-alanyl-D-alanine carboxypeptidase [Clostridia bacterium]